MPSTFLDRRLRPRPHRREASREASPRGRAESPSRREPRRIRGRACQAQERHDHGRHAPALVQGHLELGVRRLESRLVELEHAALVEDAAQERPQRRLGALAGLVWDPRLASLAEVVLGPLEPGQRPSRGRVRGQCRDHAEPLADEGARQRPVAVQRNPAAPFLDHLERNLGTAGGLHRQLARGVRRERLEDPVEGAVAHIRRFALVADDPSRRDAGCSRRRLSRRRLEASAESSAASTDPHRRGSELPAIRRLRAPRRPGRRSRSSSAQSAPSHSRPYSRMSSIRGTSARPFCVSAYSTRGGTLEERLTLEDALLLERPQAPATGYGG